MNKSQLTILLLVLIIGSVSTELSAENEKPKLLAWNDSVPFGNISELAENVPFVKGNYGVVEVPVLGPILAQDKAGPEFFIHINQAAFEEKGHIRGVQYDWWKNEVEVVHMTLDLTGSEVVVKNAEYGNEGGYFYQNLIWDDVEYAAVYQVFFEYNPSYYESTYLEYEYEGNLYYCGEYKE